jgi:hypothetical protein
VKVAKDHNGIADNSFVFDNDARLCGRLVLQALCFQGYSKNMMTLPRLLQTQLKRNVYNLRQVAPVDPTCMGPPESNGPCENGTHTPHTTRELEASV